MALDEVSEPAEKRSWIVIVSCFPENKKAFYYFYYINVMFKRYLLVKEVGSFLFILLSISFK